MSGLAAGIGSDEEIARFFSAKAEIEAMLVFERELAGAQQVIRVGDHHHGARADRHTARHHAVGPEPAVVADLHRDLGAGVNQSLHFAPALFPNQHPTNHFHAARGGARAAADEA